VEGSELYADALIGLGELLRSRQTIASRGDRPAHAATAAANVAENATWATESAARYAFWSAEDAQMVPKNKTWWRIESVEQTVVLHDIFGNPFLPVTTDPSWLTSTVTNLAQAIYQERAFERMPILADALEDAGCTNQDVLNHCRGDGEHVRGCWVVDLLLGKG
jgi:hypothetical protein